ncbi:MAG: flagellar biosynthetic protein FliR, partial [Planctomycetota bacterium]
SLAIGALILPSVPATMPTPMPLNAGFILLVVQEVAVGMCMGFALSLLFEGVRGGGELINRYAGFTAAENFDPDSGIGEGPIGDMLVVGMVILFFAANMHHETIAAISRSFSAVPIGGWSLNPAMLHLASKGTGDCMAVACAISFPVLGVTMLVTVCEGVLSKAVPQINILTLSFSLKILLALIVVWAGLPMVVAFMGTCLVASQNILATALKAM